MKTHTARKYRCWNDCDTGQQAADPPPNSMMPASAFLRALVWLFGILIFTFNAWWLTQTDDFRDFGSFVASAQLYQTGDNPYTPDHPMVFFVEFPEIDLKSYSVNLNPPISILLLAPLARIDPIVAFPLWRLISLLLYAVTACGLLSVYPQLSNRFGALWVLCLAGFWCNLEHGQIYAALMPLSAGAWLALRSNRMVLAGILIGALAAIKPNFLIWPLLLIIGGSHLAGAMAFATAALLSMVPVVILGPGIYLDWLRASQAFGGLAFPGNASLVGLFVRFDLPVIGLMLGLLLTAALAFIVRTHGLDALEASAVGLLASLLVAPIAWTGYLVLLLPIYLSRRWTPLLRTSAIMLTMPFLLVLLTFQTSWFGFTIMGWFYGWALLLLLIDLLRDVFLRRSSGALAEHALQHGAMAVIQGSSTEGV